MEKKIVLSIDEMKHLESLGLDTSDASMFYNNIAELDKCITLVVLEEGSLPLCELINKYGKKSIIPAYTLQDILEKLPKEIEFNGMTFFLWWSGSVFSYSMLDENGNYKGAYHEAFDHNGDSILEGAYDMLLWCIENNYIKTNKL